MLSQHDTDIASMGVDGKNDQKHKTCTHFLPRIVLEDMQRPGIRKVRTKKLTPIGSISSRGVCQEHHRRGGLSQYICKRI